MSLQPPVPENVESADPILELRNLHAAYYGGMQILQGLDLKVREGSITGVVGPNGAGKSTALKVVFGFLEPTLGDVILDGERINNCAAHELISRRVAYVPQNRSVCEELTVEDNLKLACWPFRKDRFRIARAVDRACEMFPVLAEKFKARAETLSGGQQRLLELARALVQDPKLILLDEPTAMIAPRISREIYRFLSTLPDLGITVLLVDQNVRQCAAVSDYLYVLELGRTRAQGNRAQFHDDEQLRAMIADWLDYELD